jgi:hypothetical protein
VTVISTLTGSSLIVVTAKFETVDQGSTHKPPMLAQLCPLMTKSTLNSSVVDDRAGVYTSIEHRRVVPEGIPLICWTRSSCGEKVVDNCRKGVPSSAGILLVVTTATRVSPPPFPIETEKGRSVPVLKSPFSNRFGTQGSALELAAAEDDITELSRRVEVLDEMALEDASDDDDMTELSETLEVADEIALEETAEPGSTSPQGGCCSTALGLYRIEN